MNLGYLLLPFVAWFTAGSVKFIVNSVRHRSLAFAQIGYGGFPSNHSTIVSSVVTLIGLQEGITHPAFGVSLAVAFIVIMDAISLRREVGLHATILNKLKGSEGTELRQSIGHTRLEVFSGVCLGVALGFLVYLLEL